MKGLQIMNCIICRNGMVHAFSKDFNVFGLTKVDYWRCPTCGFTMSKTHAAMNPTEWESLNHDYHSAYLGTEVNMDDPRWLARLQSQATVLHDAAEIGLLNPKGKWLDYACGDGKLSELLERHQHKLLK